MASTKQPAPDLEYLCRAMKAPSLLKSVERLSERARSETWAYEEFLAACLEREVAARAVKRRRDPHPGGTLPGEKDPRGLRLRPPAFLEAGGDRPPRGARLRRGRRRTSCSWALPGRGRATSRSGSRMRACQAGHRVAVRHGGRMGRPPGRGPSRRHGCNDELVRLGRYPLIIIDEVGYIPFEAEAANLFFQLVSSRYERASVIVTSNKPFGRWGEVFGDPVVAAAMIDRLVHHAEVVSMKGDSYRLKDRDLGRVPNDDAA